MVELASVIAEEKFSDRPRCVCPVIGAFLRGWNDRASHAERQRLGPYAERIVGSRDTPQATRERRDLCLEWTGADLGDGGARRTMRRTAMRLRIAIFCGMSAGARLNEGAGDYAARVAAARADTDGAFELLESLLAIGERGRPAPPSPHANGSSHPGVNGNGRGATPSPNGRPVSNGNGSTANGSAPERRPLTQPRQ